VGECRPQELPGMAPRPRRRLTIGVSMVLLAALAVPMAWVSNHARTQDRALVAIGRAGGFVIYDFQRDPEGMILNEGSSDPSLNWLRKLVPAHYYRDFNVASLRGAQANDDAIGQIAGLGQIEELYLDNSGVTDAGLAQLRGLKHLKFLDLVGTQVTDAGLAHLSGLRELTYLRLSGKPVTDAGLAHLSGLREQQSGRYPRAGGYHRRSERLSGPIRVVCVAAGLSGPPCEPEIAALSDRPAPRPLARRGSQRSRRPRPTRCSRAGPSCSRRGPSPAGRRFGKPRRDRPRNRHVQRADKGRPWEGELGRPRDGPRKTWKTRPQGSGRGTTPPRCLSCREGPTGSPSCGRPGIARTRHRGAR
jgi:hypothetical protein